MRNTCCKWLFAPRRERGQRILVLPSRSDPRASWMRRLPAAISQMALARSAECYQDHCSCRRQIRAFDKLGCTTSQLSMAVSLISILSGSYDISDSLSIAHVQIACCDQLLAFLGRYAPAAQEAATSAVSQSVQAPEGMKVLKKKGTEEELDSMFTGLGGGKGGKGRGKKSRNSSSDGSKPKDTKLNFSPEIYQGFSKVKVCAVGHFFLQQASRGGGGGGGQQKKHIKLDFTPEIPGLVSDQDVCGYKWRFCLQQQYAIVIFAAASECWSARTIHE